MSDNNAITIKTYNDEYQVYLGRTAPEVTGSIKEFIDAFLAHVKKDSAIVEIGSGPGRDADYIESLGYTVVRTDAAQNFVEHMKKQGHDAKVLDIINENPSEQCDAVFANAVFLHFDKADFNKAVSHVAGMLHKNGVFALSLHEGTYSGLSSHKHSARYFHEWTKDDLVNALLHHGFEVLEILPGESVSKRKKWIMLILQRR